ncbi:uncharacterized protein EV420DRAFT_557404 [Desarmillaria tabescens]|uniref:Uncharacterized protein n=1 Tax=Armillaria tabescens TaxID=1929756 RepID=A0AA39K6Y4_ARMTA|nr:uncharacterized protein EV420DRAFT_557404 [Desarmillaria tabescens]KAK0455714.1 hypothetical protein EV420DRAFT_557404 [Desarmillaria tabescens]
MTTLAFTFFAFMLSTVKKMFTRYLNPIALYPWRSYFVFIIILLLWTRNKGFIAFGAIAGAVYPVSRTIIAEQEHHKKIMSEMFKNVGLQFNELSAYLDDQRNTFQVNDEESDALQLCSSTITQQCLLSKQRADDLYSAAQTFIAGAFPRWSDFAQIVIALRKEDEKIRAIVESYSAYKVTLSAIPPHDQLEAAQQWTDEINAAYPPITTDPVNGNSL